MSPKIVTVEEAGTRLLELIGLAEQGEEVVIAYEDQPKVKLVPIRRAPQKRVFGQHRGLIWMRPDFDEPLPEKLLAQWDTMRLLLDTHTFLWLDGSPEQLSPAALAACEDPTNKLYLSDASASVALVETSRSSVSGR